MDMLQWLTSFVYTNQMSQNRQQIGNIWPSEPHPLATQIALQELGHTLQKRYRSTAYTNIQQPDCTTIWQPIPSRWNLQNLISRCLLSLTSPLPSHFSISCLLYYNTLIIPFSACGFQNRHYAKFQNYEGWHLYSLILNSCFMLISHTFQENQCMLKVFVECMVCFGELKEASSF